MAKYKSRKKLLKEPDEFITFTGRAIEFCREYQKQLIGGVAVLVIIMIGVSFFRYSSAQNEEEASLKLVKAQEAYSAAISSGSPEAALKKVEDQFKVILDEYSSKQAGRRARIIFADICYDAKQIDRAIEMYKASLQDWGSQPSIKNSILSSLGYAYEQKKDYKTALTYYEQIRNSTSSNAKACAIYNLGRIYAKLDDQKKSMEAFKQIDKDYPDFMYAQLVKEKI